VAAVRDDETEATVVQQVPQAIDVNTPNVARIYDYMLGGKDNFAADRAAAEQILSAYPESREGVQHNRAFLGKAVEYLVEKAAIRQFVDIGTGLPTQQNVHQVAQSLAPDARIVYVDNDPMVCVHGRALLAGVDGVAMVDADLREPDAILGAPELSRLVDLDQPVAVLLVATLHFVRDSDDPFGAVERIRSALAPGSHLVISHLLDTEQRRTDTGQVRQVYEKSSSAGLRPRTEEEILRFFGEFELIDTDLFVPADLREKFAGIGWAGVGRKP
jgi:S-adenosyl methyltransferase